MRELELIKKKKNLRERERGDESDRWEKEELKDNWATVEVQLKDNKMLIFCFTIKLQCDSTFRIAL